MPSLSRAEITETTQTALERHGASAQVAAQVADAVGIAEGYGNVICGLYYLESYCQQLVTGRVNGTVTPIVTTPRPGHVTVDAGFGFAQPAFAAAKDAAIVAARSQGIALLTVAHAHTCTSLGYFTEQLARDGIIAIGATNASPIVAPPGGKSRVIGTNPFSFSVPGAPGEIAMHIDFSTSTVALGKITQAKAAGQTIPLGWAVDVDGHPTTDPDAALGGALVSMGEYKGYGIGLMVELLAAGLTGSVNSVDVKPLKAPDGPPHDLGQTYILIDPTISTAFPDRLARVTQAVAESDGGRIPGKGRRPKDQIDVDDAIWTLTQSLANGSRYKASQKGEKSFSGGRTFLE